MARTTHACHAICVFRTGSRTRPEGGRNVQAGGDPSVRLEGVTVAKYADIAVKANVDSVQNLVQQAFGANGFSVKWESGLKGKAEKGSRGLNIALGALAQYYGIDFEIHPGGDLATLRLHKANTGLAGGIIGVARVNKQFNQVADTLAGWFQTQGVLQGVKKE